MAASPLGTLDFLAELLAVPPSDAAGGDEGATAESPSVVLRLAPGTQAPRPAATPAVSQSSRSWTLEPSNSDSDEGGVVTGVFIRKREFTGSLGSSRIGEEVAEENDWASVIFSCWPSKHEPLLLFSSYLMYSGPCT
jgi:hypothetical protein